MGDIGKPQREVEFEPIPDTPAPEPVKQPEPRPVKQPQPA